MLHPTYNDPPDVGRCCGHFLIGQVHVSRRSPHTHRTPHTTHHTVRHATVPRCLRRTTRLCAEEIKEMCPISESHLPTRHMRHAQSPAQSSATPTVASSRSPERQSALELSRCPSQRSFVYRQHAVETTCCIRLYNCKVGQPIVKVKL